MNKLYTSKLFLTALGLSISMGTFAQGEFINNNAKIVVNSGTNVILGSSSAAVSFINESGGSVENNGDIYVTGNWENNDAGGVFSTSAGNVHLNGSSAQDIEGSQVTDFYNLNLTNARKRLDGVNARVDNQVSITSTALDLNTRTLFVESNATTAITESSGYIISETGPAAGYGKVDWNIGNNTGTYVVPFGTNEVTPVNLEFEYDIVNVGTVGSMGRVQFSTYPTTDHTTNLPWPTGVQHMTDDFGQNNMDWVLDRYWVVDNNMQSNGYTSNWPRIDYTFTYDDDDWNQGTNQITEAQLVAQRYNDIDDLWLDWLYSDVANAGTNKLTMVLNNDLDYYDVWTLVDNSDPLPIELIKFSANCEASETVINWTTASETNNDYFTIERSQDGSVFEEVAVIDGAGTSGELNSYEVTDKYPYAGTSYYRIKQTDFDGNFEYSDLVAVSCADDNTDFGIISAYDDGNGNMNIAFNAGENDIYTATLYDIQGRLMIEESGRTYAGTNQVKLNVANFARGIYMLTLRNEHKAISKRVMLN
jgi:hypothetical protein